MQDERTMTVLDEIAAYGLVPLVTLDDAADAVPLAEALRDGGLPIAEVTFRTDAAAESIQRIHEAVPEVILGAGTVHTVEQARDAVARGAVFIVTPAFNPAVIEWCLAEGIAVLPGSATPRDFEDALAYGLETLKFFPASVYGGIEALRAFAGPFAGLRFVPTGGVTTGNMADYLALGNVAAVGGSFVCPSKLVKAKDWAGIAALGRQLVQDLLDLRLVHVGINCPDEASYEVTASAFAELLGLPLRRTDASQFVGRPLEIMAPGGRATQGHLAFDTPQIERAVRHFAARGYACDQSTARYDARGRLEFIYLREEIAGYGIHLLRRS